MKALWHQFNIRVGYKDTDQMGVVHHGNYITWFEVGRTEWLRHFGQSYSKLEEQGLLLPVVDVHVQYRRPAKYDDCVAIFTKVNHVSPVRLEFTYETRGISESEFKQVQAGLRMEPFGELLAKGSTMHMWITDKWKPVRMNRAVPELYAILTQSAYP